MKRDKGEGPIERYLEEERLTESQRETAKEFHKHLINTGRTLNTRIEYVRIVTKFAELLEGRPYGAVTREDFSNFMHGLHDKAPATKENHYASLRVFYMWMKERDGKDYITLLAPERYKRPAGENYIVAAEDLPTEEEVLRIIKFAGNPRDKCMIAMSFDLGTRPHELLSVNIGNVRFDEYGATVTVGKSKSMKRTLRLISSLPYLREWFENHPYNDNPEAPLFIGLGNTQFGNRIEPQTLRYALQQAAKRAGITKRIYTYQLRHSSVTQNAVIGLTEQQLKAFYGWRPASKMLNVYSHITSEDVNHARLAQAGKIEIEKKPPKIELLTCPRCGAENPPTHEYCSKCASPLDEQKYRELMSKEDELEALKQKYAAQEEVLEAKIAALKSEKEDELEALKERFRELEAKEEVLEALKERMQKMEEFFEKESKNPTPVYDRPASFTRWNDDE